MSVDVFKGWALSLWPWRAEARIPSGLPVVSGVTLGRDNSVVFLSQTSVYFLDVIFKMLCVLYDLIKTAVGHLTGLGEWKLGARLNLF